MFKKLLSNLSFNPSLITQVSFYAKRVHKESAVRRSGLIVLVLAVALQMFAVISPPQATLADTANNILRDGFSSKQDAIDKCRSNTQDYATILSYYHISCDTLASDKTEVVAKLLSTDFDRKLDSMGRTAQGPIVGRTGKATDEYSISINGYSYYMRNLWSFDSNINSPYRALKVTNAEGVEMYLLYDCGNVVTIDHYYPPAPPPAPAPTPTPTPTPTPVPLPVDVCPDTPDRQTSIDQCDVCPNLPNTQTDVAQCYPCEKAKTDTTSTAPCLTYSKSATNTTQGIIDANNTTAHAGDTIVYTLGVKNTGNNTFKDFRVTERLADVLEYADIVDLNGGSTEPDSYVAWPKTDIAAGETIYRKITVRVKDPIPQTPSPPSDPGSYDLIMTNVFFGNTVTINLPATPIKVVSMVTAKLPNTGPGSSVMVGAGLAVIVAYLFARSRLIAKELDIVRAEQTTSGGV